MCSLGQNGVLHCIFVCICIVADMKLCVCVMCLCVLLHDIILTTPFLEREPLKAKRCECQLFMRPCLLTMHKKITNEKYNALHKTIIQKYETRNSNAVSVNSFCKLVFAMHVCRCEFEPSTLRMYHSACVSTVQICAFICYQVNCHF